MPRERRKPESSLSSDTDAKVELNNSDSKDENNAEIPIFTGKRRGRPRQPRPEVLSSKGQFNDKKAGEDTNDDRSPNKAMHDDSTKEKKRGRQKDEQKSNLNCEYCGKFFKFRATLKQHEQIHFGIKEFECEFCHRRFLHKGTLKVHLRLHTGEMPYKCPHCPKQFRGQTALDCHVFRHTKQGTKCPQCASVFATPSIVKQHIREVHTTERLNTCQICGVTYKHLKSLRLHLRNHQKRVCPDCGKVFHSVYVMMTHRKIHAQDHFQFKCTFCERKFEKEDELVSHNKLRGRTYQCEMCCHSFNKADYLANHNRRYHWKELGLEQLKVAPPKNGWNRKGVPKPKKKQSGDEQNVVVNEQNIELAEGTYNVGAPVRQKTWQNLTAPNLDAGDYAINGVSLEIPITVETINNSSDVVVKGDKNVLIEILEAPSDSQPARVLKTITTEIEPALPFQKSDLKLEESVRIESINYDSRLESDHDYAGDDDCRENENDDATVDDEVVMECSEIKHKIKEELKMEAGVTNIGTSFVYENTPADESKGSPMKISKDEAEPISDEDEKPLAALLPKYPLNKLESQTEEADIFVKLPSQCTGTELDFLKGDLGSTDGHLSDEDVDEKPLQSRKQKKAYFCSQCGVSFNRQAALKRHRKTDHRDEKRTQGPFVCEVCGKLYANNTSLICHRSRHEEYKRYKCDECPKAFTFRCYLESHKRAEHLHERLICPICGKQFKYSQDLKVHTRQHEDDKPFKCDECPSAFRYPSALRSHKACHEKTVFTCEICNKTFKYANSLRVHKRLHSGVKRFRCEICDREFNTKAPLVRHLATHSLDREMKCVACGKIFYKKVDLVIHQSKEHPNNPIIGKTVKIHTCEVCGQEFSKKSNMKAHAYIHGDVYKYKCKLCEDQQFKQHAGLRHHLIHYHKMDLSKKTAKSDCEANVETVDVSLTPAVDIGKQELELMVSCDAV